MSTQESRQTPGSRRKCDKFAVNNSPLFNWLADLDTKAKDLPPAQEWHEYTAFMYARYPRLKPRDVPRSEYKEVSQIISWWKKSILSHDEAERCMTGLSARLQAELAALTRDTSLALESYRERRDVARSIDKLRTEGPRRHRKLIRKFKRVIDTLTELQAACEKSIYPALAEPLQKTISECLLVLHQMSPTPIYPNSFPESGEPFLSPLDKGMAQLYWFFRHGCSLSGDESEVRTALIRNAFWTDHGVRRVSFREKYEDAESRGCGAVQQAVRRFSKAQGTSR